MTLIAARNKRIGTENAFKIGPYITGLEAEGHKVIRCNLGEPDFPLPAHIRDEVKRQLDLDNVHYCDPQGVLPLRQAIAQDMGAKRNIHITPDRVVVFPGGKPPIGFAQQIYCEAGDEVIYPSPGYPVYESFIDYVGAVAKPLHLEESAGFSFTGADLAPLITDRTKLIIINFPSNPTGGVATRDQLEGIADVIKAKASPDVRVYSDEIYENILFDGKEHVSIASLPGMADRTILVSGASKSYSWTGGRLGWAVLPTVEEAMLFKNMNINYISCVSPYTQMGGVTALTSPKTAPAVRAMVDAFQERRDIVVAGLNAIDGISCETPSGAFYVFPNIGGVCEKLGVVAAYGALPPDIQRQTSPSSMFQMFLLLEHHVAAMDRRSFGAIGSEGRHFLRLSIATCIDDLKTALVRLEKASTDTAGFARFMKENSPPWN